MKYKERRRDVGFIKFSSMFQDDNNTEIKVKSLQRVNVKDIDMPNVKTLVKGIKKRLIPVFIFLLIFVLIFPIMVYNDLKSSYEIDIVEITSDILVLGLPLYLFFFYIAKQLILTRSDKYKKAQYGIVKAKFKLRPIAKSTTKRNYYINALFPESNTFITRVECTKEVYDKLSEGHQVLVIAFDNYQAYAVPSISIR